MSEREQLAILKSEAKLARSFRLAVVTALNMGDEAEFDHGEFPDMEIVAAAKEASAVAVRLADEVASLRAQVHEGWQHLAATRDALGREAQARALAEARADGLARAGRSAPYGP